MQQLLEGIITSSGLEILCTCSKSLTEKEVRILYASIFKDNADEIPDWLTDIRTEILEFMTSGESFSYFVTGADAVHKTHVIKSLFRNSYSANVNKKVVRNGVHSSDPDEVTLDLKILFSNEYIES
jgi:nucleoside diphosphate kinase